MRIALFSDIHSNYTGLCAVLAAIYAAGGVDLCIAAGDHIGGESGGDDLLDLLISHGVQMIQGDSDTDEKLVFLAQKAIQHPGSTRNSLAYYQDMRAWIHQNISAANRSLLATLPKELTVEVAPDQRLYVCHASPRAINDPICAPLTNPTVLRQVYGRIGARVIAFGHWHASYVRWLDDRLYLNVASVGFRHDGLSSLTLVTYEDDQWVVEQQAVPYDTVAEAQRVKARKVPRPNL